MRKNWQEEARTAREQLKLVPHGDRERQMVSMAKLVSEQTGPSGLRRAIAALEFLEHLKSARPLEYYDALRNAPLAVVAVIGKWYAFDQNKALVVALDYGKHKLAAKSLAHQMSSARLGFSGKTGGVFDRAYSSTADSYIADKLQDLIKKQLGPAERSVKDKQTGTVIDFLFTLSEPSERIAVLIIGPYTNKNLYVHRCADWVTRGFGLCWFYDRVVLALPDFDPMDEYVRRATIASAQEGSGGIRSMTTKPLLDVLFIDRPPLADEDDEALAKLAP